MFRWRGGGCDGSYQDTNPPSSCKPAGGKSQRKGGCSDNKTALMSPPGGRRRSRPPAPPPPPAPRQPTNRPRTDARTHARTAGGAGGGAGPRGRPGLGRLWLGPLAPRTDRYSRGRLLPSLPVPQGRLLPRPGYHRQSSGRPQPQSATASAACCLGRLLPRLPVVWPPLAAAGRPVASDHYGVGCLLLSLPVL